MKRSRLIVAALAAVALVLGGLIYRDVFVGTKNAASSLNLYTVARRTVTSSVTGTGNLVPMQQANVSFKVSGILTEIDLRVGDRVHAGQVLARVDPTQEQNALASAQANLAMAQANLQSAETPLTQNQIAQLRDNVTTAQQQYNDAVAQVNLTNTQDASQVTADQNQLSADQQALTFNAAYQAAKQTLSTDQAALQTAIDQFNADGCKAQTYPYTGSCVPDFNTVSTDQSKVNTDQLSVNGFTVAVTTDQSKLNQDTAKQQSDKTSGQRSINQAVASVTSAQDALKTQTESKPNQILSAQAQLASAQAAVQTAQQNLAATTLVAPMDGVVNSINGVVGESAITGSGTTAEAPGTQAPLPTSQASSAFMVIGDVSGMEVVIPFAESDASKLAFNQDTQVTFDAVPNLTISGHVVAVGSAATVQSGVVNYYATVALNQTNPALKQGMTSNATVVVSKATNAVVVPNLAITRLGGQAYVNVLVNGRQVQTQIETGVVGDQFTEITGGLSEGAQVVIPTLRVSSSSGGVRNGGGGVRIGGGG
ncbi:MAG: biotin/lipoyl-binding protein [Chloroflexi bacterium]|nr:MAG: biotin/lipoyl-binding protein [Chloroflexota bacterium]